MKEGGADVSATSKCGVSTEATEAPGFIEID
jgi:hypothetical protein